MLLWLFEQLAGYHSSFQVVRYLTLRSLLSVLTSLTIGLVLGPIMIRKLQALKYGQAVSSFAPENHAKKMGTPTMGGILILLSIGISTLLWADLSNPYVWIVLGVMVVFGAVGWADDWIKIFLDFCCIPWCWYCVIFKRNSTVQCRTYGKHAGFIDSIL